MRNGSRCTPVLLSRPDVSVGAADVTFRVPANEQKADQTGVGLPREPTTRHRRTEPSETPRDLWGMMLLSLSIFSVSVHLGKFSFHNGRGVESPQLFVGVGCNLMQLQL